MTWTTRLLPRAVGLLLLPLGIALFFLLAHVTEVHASTRNESNVRVPVPAPVADPRVAQGNVISTIQSVINYVINATVFFPARTFQEAIEKATRNIFSEQLDEFREPLEQVVAVYAFQNGAVFGSLAIPGEVNAIGARLTEAAVPIWALGLVLIGLSVLTRNAVGMGHGMAEVAAELARWLFIALASGNAIAIVNLVHTGFGALTYAIASEGGTVTASQFVAAFIPSEATFGVWPILLLVIGCVLGLIVILVLSATYIARYVVLLAITGLAPICIACEGIPFTRFVFRDWLSMFLRLEFLQIINIAVLIVFKALALGAAGSGVTQALLRLAIMIGLASAIIGINLSIFKQVFGVAIDVVAQMRQAAEQIVRVIGVAIGAAVTGGVAVPALAGAASSSSASGGSGATPNLPSGEAQSSPDTTNAAALGASGRAAWALSGALGGAAGGFMRGYGDGAFASSDFNARRAGTARAEEMQRASETRRAEALAREMGATHSDDIEAIAKSVTEPEHGHTSDQMMRAHRDNAPALREMAQHYGGPARAAAVGGYRSFGDMAVAMAHERLGEGGSPMQTPIAAPAGAPHNAADERAAWARPASVDSAPQATPIDTVTSAASRSTTQDGLRADAAPGRGAEGSVPMAARLPGTSNMGDGLRVDVGQPPSSPAAPTPTSHEASAILASPDAAGSEGGAESRSSATPATAASIEQQAPVPMTSDLATMSAPAGGDGLHVDAMPAPAAAPSPSDGLQVESMPKASTPVPISSDLPAATQSGLPQINEAVQPAMTDGAQPALPTTPFAEPSSAIALPMMDARRVEPISPTTPSTPAEPITPMPLPASDAWSAATALPSLPRDTPLADWAAQVPPAPIHDWIHTPPHIGSPGEQSILPFDFGMGAMLARVTESSPTHAPLWAQTAYSLRMAYGESYVQSVLQEAQSARWSEPELMSRVERHVVTTPSPRVVSLFWKPGEAMSRPSGQRGRSNA